MWQKPEFVAMKDAQTKSGKEDFAGAGGMGQKPNCEGCTNNVQKGGVSCLPEAIRKVVCYPMLLERLISAIVSALRLLEHTQLAILQKLCVRS